MFVYDEKTILKANKSQEKINNQILSKLILDKAERHVVEPNEPMMDKFTDNFHLEYGKTVVAPSMKEIVSIIKLSDES